MTGNIVYGALKLHLQYYEHTHIKNGGIGS
jgi:hypothetical protein